LEHIPLFRGNSAFLGPGRVDSPLIFALRDSTETTRSLAQIAKKQKLEEYLVEPEGTDEPFRDAFTTLIDPRGDQSSVCFHRRK
jgi:hypothetical protein